jgi:ornithine cyclodeaminase/alanine dehydrogenase-like protein (mu-crystallin family)
MKDTKDTSLLYLSRADVEAAGLDMPTVIALLETAFLEKGEGRVEMPPKPGIHPGPDAFIHAMPALIPKMRAAGIKWVGGFPENPRRGLPYISGLIILNDVETGLPTAIMDCTWITGYRTAGATAVAARLLARPDSETAAILGCGLQGRTHLLALAAIFPLKRVLAYDISAPALKAFIKEMSPKLGLQIDPVSEPRRAVEASDLVVTAGPLLKNPDPVIEKDWLQPGAFAGAVDFDSYWKPDALLQMDKLATDDIPQFQYYRTVGYFRQTPDPYADLGEILAGRKPGRVSASERTMAMNLGLAIGDMAVAPEVLRRAVERGLGVRLPL